VSGAVSTEPVAAPDEESTETESERGREVSASKTGEMGENQEMKKELTKDRGKRTRDFVLRLTVETYPRFVEKVEFLRKC
jgi:hypothetical protein